MRFQSSGITEKQIQFIEILANDLKLDRFRRNKHISLKCNRRIEHLDELTKLEASLVIDWFLEMKENSCQ